MVRFLPFFVLTFACACIEAPPDFDSNNSNSSNNSQNNTANNAANNVVSPNNTNAQSNNDTVQPNNQTTRPNNSTNNPTNNPTNGQNNQPGVQFTVTLPPHTSELRNVPVLIRLDDPSLEQISVPRAVVASDSSMGTQIDNQMGSRLAFWTRWPAVGTSSTSQTFTIVESAESAATTVWSEMAGVWHMGNGPIADSTGSNIHLTTDGCESNCVTHITHIEGAVRLNRATLVSSSRRLILPSSWTVMFWFRTPSTAGPVLSLKDDSLKYLDISLSDPYLSVVASTGMGVINSYFAESASNQWRFIAIHVSATGAISTSVNGGEFSPLLIGAGIPSIGSSVSITLGDAGANMEFDEVWIGEISPAAARYVYLNQLNVAEVTPIIRFHDQ